MKPTWQRAAVVLTVLLAAASIVSAQTTGDIRGTVTDDTGAVLPGASVTIYSDAIIGGSRTDVTNSVGVYRFPSLPVGTYIVEISMDNFETLRYENVQVQLNVTSTIDAILKIATVAETVTVVGESPVVDVTSSSVRTSFKNELVEDLPTNRNFYDYIQLAPGMSGVYSGTGGGDRTVAFGSNQQSNSWNIDGIETSAPETGSSWMDVNPDDIAEVEILGVGAPAEFGNATGAVFNVVTKKGGDDFAGSGAYYFQHDSLTGQNVSADELEALGYDPFPYERDSFYDLTGRLGGPIARNKAWFFVSGQIAQDKDWQPGVDNTVAGSDTWKVERWDTKINMRLTDRNELGFMFHVDDWDSIAGGDAFTTDSAAYVERGRTYGYGGNLTSTLSPNTLLEVKYTGWWADDVHDSPTGSFEEPFADYTPPGGGPPTYSGGVIYPWDYITWSQQFRAKATHYAEDFLSAQHEFKFGVQIARGDAATNVSAGPNGTYTYSYYGYYYQVRQDPYQYGGISWDRGIFLDDTVTVSDKLTLNLGVRFDFNTGGIPDYKRLAPGTPSIATAINAMETDETIPGAPDLINWNLVSPRLGFAFQPTEDGRTVIKGFFGVFYDQNVIGNWDAPAPGLPPYQIFEYDPATDTVGDLIFATTSEDVAFHPDLRPPRTLQYTAGFDQQFGPDISFGAQYVYKETKDLVGWEILDGVYETVPFTDPFTGTQYQLLNQLEAPILRKGNDPGNFPGAENLDYEQTYHGATFSLAKRFSSSWSLQGSYTWSKSEGLIPRPWFQAQNNPFYGSSTGRDPNAYLNAYGRLQADRPHMLRLQGVFQLPGDFMLSTSVNVESGKPFNRQTRVFGFNQSTPYVILAPSGSDDVSFGGELRRPTQKNIDILIGKRINLGGNAVLKIDATIYNLLNDDADLFFADLRLQEPGDQFIPNDWMLPRRLMLKLGFEF
jgi:hypothetical protein